jgi:site-specific DNA recombinase
MTKAVIYSRFSTDRQNESSITDQVRICTEHALGQGWKILQHYEDQGISGAALGNRPGVRRMLEAALAQRFDVLLVTDLSRLSRSQGDLSKEIDRLVAKGIRVIGVQDGYDSARRGHKLQAGLSGIIGEAFREMVKERTYSALESRARDRRPTGGRAYGYRNGAVEPVEFEIVREIFRRSGEGESTHSIAAELNARRVPSPGSTWARKERRCVGWAGSAVRVILRNPRYIGRIVWNASTWIKDPDTGRRRRTMRPASERIEHTDEALRIITDEEWERVQRRGTVHQPSAKTHTAGKPKYLLSGLLRCGNCGGSFILSSKDGYSCSAYHDGRACANAHYVPRARAEHVVLGDIRAGLLDPGRVSRMAVEMQRYYSERMRDAHARLVEVPRELREIDARIERLQERLRAGDPDLDPDEIEAVIARAQAKRRELAAAEPGTQHMAEVIRMLPKAAELYCKQIDAGLSGDPVAAQKGRVIVRDLLDGPVKLMPYEDGTLWAKFALRPAALLTFNNRLGISGSGGRI